MPTDNQGHDPCDHDVPERISGSLRYTDGAECDAKDKDAHFDVMRDLSEHVWKNRGRFLSPYVCGYLAFRLLAGLRLSFSIPNVFFSRSAGFFFPRQLWHRSSSLSEPTDAGMRSVRSLVPKKALKDTDEACPLPLLCWDYWGCPL